MNNDTQQREQALQPQHSFIVQAPAGSGKTTLLTQRFLTLLAHAKKNPEEILAITFTRKAAAEMRYRIITALQDCADNPKPTAPLAQKTWELATKALARDKQLKWNLLSNPNRLRIQTIDSLCMHLAQQMPLSANFATQYTIADDQQVLYLKAARELLLQIDAKMPWTNAIKTLLAHLDNKFTNAEKLLANMLAKRDQWLPYLVDKQQISRQELEQGLQAISDDCLEKLNSTKPTALMAELEELATFANANLDNLSFTTIKDKWLFLADLLLTKENTLRKQVNKTTGFPAKNSTTDSKTKNLFVNIKKRMQNLLQQLQSQQDFIQALIELKNIPPIKYTEQQWEIIAALTTLLPVAAAQLKLIFHETKQADFVEISQAALNALGTTDNPTELALNLDYKIQHILVDEFQDTSTTQFHLLELLTAGWEMHDGHTLFIVGDPMQSIYRFREAEVGLFLRARNEGIGNIKLISLTLSANFRSHKSLVTWFNQTFAAMFPTTEDITSGAITYSPATSIHDNRQDTTVTIHPLINADALAEAQHVLQLIKTCKQQNNNVKIAVLVKSRNHANAILRMLRLHDIRYQALEFDKLNTRPVIQDLLALTKAILHLADRIAWLSILRAPWCGLTLTELHIIANPESKITIWQQLNNPSIIKKLNESSQQRLINLVNIMSQALYAKGRKKLRSLITDTWKALHGPMCVNNATELQDAQAYFNLLDALEIGGDIKDFQLLQNKIDTLYATPDINADDTLQIMTIHKAKGLEFDVVILPGLHHIPPKQEQQLLLWMVRPRIHQKNDLILAPIKEVTDANDPVYTYLRYENEVRNQLEEMRLFYVAATRAKNQLHLIGNLDYATEDDVQLKSPVNKSFLKLIWPSVQQNFIAAINNNQISTTNNKETKIGNTTNNPKYLLLPNNSIPLQHINNLDDFTATPQIISINDINDAQYIGTVIHKILYQISIDGIAQWPTQRIHANKNHWSNMLLQLGINPTQLEFAIQQINTAIQNTINDSRGQWILTDHVNAKSEFAISTNKDNCLQRLVIDRTFIDTDNNVWIIDYKTTKYNGNQLARFLAAEKEKHQRQLENYANVLHKLYTKLSVNTHYNNICFGLYFPLITAWIDWH